ncbi:hypothetical protein JAAARDRAFT_126119 [Jaapia argillacea MUCL 33604]|uniref:Purine-cytosine permease n=1 Tax=Jaapia argillacea MUCL 33604 TaxID=933084 RepID=A0A067QCR5_9AGAM|nr:hypothetical protein JAAARDRAFT_126119 [Jaapia argillacea MUCL 33604]
MQEKGEDGASVEGYEEVWFGRSVSKKLLSWGVEARGILPVPVEERTDKQFSKIFFIWLSANFNILSFSAGTLGPVVFGLGLRDSCLVILFFNLLCSLPPAYLTTWGPKLGLRQMCQARYSFGYYGVILPCVLNCINMCGFCILNCILGGQALSSVSNGHLSWSVGIVVIALISLLVSFCGYKVLNWYERACWIPVLIIFIIILGVGGHHLSSPPPASPALASTILSFGATIAGFVITYSPLSSDFTIYLDSKVAGWKIFWYSYAGLVVPIVTLQCLGAAVAVAVPAVPSWQTGYDNGNVGGLLEAMLQPVGGFGKFLTVLLSLSVTANVAMTFYSLCLNFQVFIPWLVWVPRYVFSVVATAIIVPLAIVGSHKFYDTLTNFLGLIGYWASAFLAIILVEHLVFRRPGSSFSPPSSSTSFTSYDLKSWNTPSRLPTGIAALAAGILSFAVVVPCMDQVWFVGPIAKATGDIGFEVAFAASGILYLKFRWVELKLRGI